MNKIAIILCLLSASGASAIASDTDKSANEMKMPNLTAEQRGKMADAHEKMATCLRSDKPMHECHDEMKKSCQENMGKGGCPMMDGMAMHGKGKGMHHE